VLLAAGHYRHGVLLAPLTARLVADHVECGSVDGSVDPRRFAVPAGASIVATEGGTR
jgi:glycine oxidase